MRKNTKRRGQRKARKTAKKVYGGDNPCADHEVILDQYLEVLTNIKNEVDQVDVNNFNAKAAFKVFVSVFEICKININKIGGLKDATINFFNNNYNELKKNADDPNFKITFPYLNSIKILLDNNLPDQEGNQLLPNLYDLIVQLEQTVFFKTKLIRIQSILPQQ